MRKFLPLIATAVLAVTSVPAAAADAIWFDTDHTPYSGDYALGTVLAFSGGGVNVRVSAWSIHDDGLIYQAKLGVWSGGLGVSNGSGDNSHTVDNNGFKDFLMMQFDEVVELENARFLTGWHSMSDTDATIGYLDTGLPYTSSLGLHGQSASLLSLMQPYGSGGSGNSGNSYRDINPADEAANLWLIGAAFDNPEGSKKLDGFKLEKLTFSRPPPAAVPEPGTWMMMLLGFGFLGSIMRTAKRKQRLSKTTWGGARIRTA